MLIKYFWTLNLDQHCEEWGLVKSFYRHQQGWFPKLGKVCLFPKLQLLVSKKEKNSCLLSLYSGCTRLQERWKRLAQKTPARITNARNHWAPIPFHRPRHLPLCIRQSSWWQVPPVQPLCGIRKHIPQKGAVARHLPITFIHPEIELSN